MGDLTAGHADRGDGVRIAFAGRAGGGPTIVFLPGYLSDMTGGKAMALDGWAAANGRAMLRFDYSGVGASEGDFETATLTHWRDDALFAIDSLTSGPLLLVGSSMGGWLMLLAALARPERVAGLVGIAAAPDFTDWGYTQEQKMEILSRGRVEEASAYSDTPTVTTRAFWQSGEAHRLLQGEIAIDCPVRLLHGQADPDVPWHHSLHLAERLRSADVQTLLVKRGDHRLSRESDIALLLATVAAMPEPR
ncbi:alpha/beta hydrolase [Sphingomonas flavalba]|uniref:alpha/beta hydrolase n=1 Tax=Sphingomonas flavalba TaxID=2559804 RepID=UPI00109E0339|nr:alpha/beta hydrolase [Sphingomonas flavalba]